MVDGFKTVSSSLPRLRGESNWSSWLVLINATLRANKVKRYVDTDIPQPADAAERDDWESERDVAYNLLIASCESLIDKLLNAGWTDDGNPYNLMEALKKYIPKVSEDAVAVLVDEFAKGDANDHKTLYDALKRVQYLRKRITDLCGANSDHFWSIMLLNYFKVRLPDTYKHYTNNNETPQWSKVVETIYTLAQDEEQRIALASFKTPAASISTTSSTLQRTNPSNKKDNKEKKPCDHCGRAHDTKRCFMAHPELIPQTQSNRDYLLEQAKRHICDDTCRWDSAASSSTTSSVFVKGSSGILGGSSIAGVAIKASTVVDSQHARSVASRTVFSAVDGEMVDRSDIIFDSGCTDSVFNDLALFVEYQDRNDLPPFTAAGGDLVRPQGYGTVFFQTQDPRDSSKITDWTIQGVEYSPLSPANLLSPGKLRKAGIEYDYNTCSLVNTSTARPLATIRWVSDVSVAVGSLHSNICIAD
ncbi:KilA-N domain-containing protein [Colletotrichum sojae]|uniref:KilA-N domain-containing protein n=1 Tax=Colletotrichum sojae TaxID=2175907 RepID=A0A8H6ISM2_9PEZI|nr:KilA-N domain-containing protein [Colletotrichum sojae]